MKKKLDVVRAWRDEEYRNSLSAEELAALPVHPAGTVELADVSLRSIAGGCSSNPDFSTAVYSCAVRTERGIDDCGGIY